MCIPYVNWNNYVALKFLKLSRRIYHNNWCHMVKSTSRKSSTCNCRHLKTQRHMMQQSEMQTIIHSNKMKYHSALCRMPNVDVCPLPSGWSAVGLLITLEILFISESWYARLTLFFSHRTNGYDYLTCMFIQIRIWGSPIRGDVLSCVKTLDASTILIYGSKQKNSNEITSCRSDRSSKRLQIHILIGILITSFLFLTLIFLVKLCKPYFLDGTYVLLLL